VCAGRGTAEHLRRTGGRGSSGVHGVPEDQWRERAALLAALRRGDAGSSTCALPSCGDGSARARAHAPSCGRRPPLTTTYTARRAGRPHTVASAGSPAGVHEPGAPRPADQALCAPKGPARDEIQAGPPGGHHPGRDSRSDSDGSCWLDPLIRTGRWWGARSCLPAGRVRRRPRRRARARSGRHTTWRRSAMAAR
jgi:hypothetical protein